MTSFNFNQNIFNDNSSREIKSKDNLFGDFLINNGLYEKIEITEDNIHELIDLVGGHVKLDIYCPECKENRVFSCEAIPYFSQNGFREVINIGSLENELLTWQKINSEEDRYSEDDWSWTNHTIYEDTRIMVFKFYCAMDKEHRLDYIVLAKENKLIKIGQYPSIADLSFPELKEYKRVMSKEDEKELKRAIGLFSAGIGVGSFVYLRRIFERMIMTTGETAISEGKIKEEDFKEAHVNEKINMLADRLPKLLVNNTIFYGIVSKGIHELTEDECLEFFPVMQKFIIMILREKEKMRKDKEDEAQLTKDLNKISSKLT